jgi:membrane-associated PAP2 superfamily phosphatase
VSDVGDSGRDGPAAGLPDGDVEITDLAWDRSALAMAVVGLLLVKQALPKELAHPAVGWIVIGLAAVLLLVGYSYRRHRRSLDRASRLALRLVSASTAVIGVIAFLVALVPPTPR